MTTLSVLQGADIVCMSLNLLLGLGTHLRFHSIQLTLGGTRSEERGNEKLGEAV